MTQLVHYCALVVIEALVFIVLVIYINQELQVLLFVFGSFISGRMTMYY